MLWLTRRLVGGFLDALAGFISRTGPGVLASPGHTPEVLGFEHENAIVQAGGGSSFKPVPSKLQVDPAPLLVETVSMAGAHQRYKRVVQVGTWQRSTKEFTDAIRYVREGKLGKIVKCHCWISDTFRAGGQKPTDPPKGLDYDAWVGPAKFVPYQSNRCHWNWRWFWHLWATRRVVQGSCGQIVGGGEATVHNLSIASVSHVTVHSSCFLPLSFSSSHRVSSHLDLV